MFYHDNSLFKSHWPFRLHEHEQPTFKEFLLRDKSFSIHHQNIQRLLTEIHKGFHNIPTNIYGDLFIWKNHNLNFRSRREPQFIQSLKYQTFRLNNI